jgi:hypothetical protein
MTDVGCSGQTPGRCIGTSMLAYVSGPARLRAIQAPEQMLAIDIVDLRGLY